MAIVKRWGGSLAVVVPREVALRESLAEGDEINLSFRKIPSFGEIFGSVKSRKSTQAIKEELRRGWDD